MTVALRRPELAETVFGLELAARLLAEVLPRWVQDLGLVIGKVEASRPAGAPDDWQPGALLRLPFAAGNCRDGGVVCGPALMALDVVCLRGSVERLSADDADQPFTV